MRAMRKMLANAPIAAASPRLKCILRISRAAKGPKSCRFHSQASRNWETRSPGKNTLPLLQYCSIGERDYRWRRVSKACNQRSRRTTKNVEQKTTAKETWRDDVIRSDRMIICNDRPTTLRYSTSFGYKKDDGRGCGGEQKSNR